MKLYKHSCLKTYKNVLRWYLNSPTKTLRNSFLPAHSQRTAVRVAPPSWDQITQSSSGLCATAPKMPEERIKLGVPVKHRWSWSVCAHGRPKRDKNGFKQTQKWRLNLVLPSNFALADRFSHHLWESFRYKFINLLLVCEVLSLSKMLNKYWPYFSQIYICEQNNKTAQSWSIL